MLTILDAKIGQGGREQHKHRGGIPITRYLQLVWSLSILAGDDRVVKDGDLKD